MGRCKAWSKEEEAFLLREYNKSDTVEIAEAIDRTLASVNMRAMRLGITKTKKEIIPNGYKRCTVCKKILPLDSFFNKKNSKDGKYTTCRDCCAIKSKLKHDKKRINKMDSTVEQENIDIVKKKEEKNKKYFVCRICKKKYPGKMFSFYNMKQGRFKVNCVCRFCKTKLANKSTANRIKNGKGW